MRQIFAVVTEKKDDLDITICNDRESTIKAAIEEWDHYVESEKKRYIVHGFVRNIDIESDYAILTEEYYYRDVDMDNLTVAQKSILMGYDWGDEIWNSQEWDVKTVTVRDAWGDRHKAYPSIEDALYEYDSEYEYRTGEDPEEKDKKDWCLSFDVYLDKYGREWYVVGDEGQFSDTTRQSIEDLIRKPWEWPEELIESVEL